jgi:hypothetical protein
MADLRYALKIRTEVQASLATTGTLLVDHPVLVPLGVTGEQNLGLILEVMVTDRTGESSKGDRE